MGDFVFEEKMLKISIYDWKLIKINYNGNIFFKKNIQNFNIFFKLFEFFDIFYYYLHYKNEYRLHIII